MTDESAFIRAILADPGNVGLRLVYADWLEEVGSAESLRRSQYLRIECEIERLRPDSKEARKLEARLMKVHVTLDDDWWRELDWHSVDFCLEFGWNCEHRWDNLVLTQNSGARHCTDCRRDVHYCRNEQEARTLAGAGQCVVIDSRQCRFPVFCLDESAQNKRLASWRARVPLRWRGAKGWTAVI